MRLLKSLVVVQEFGLVAVIALMMAGLWLFTSGIPRQEFVALAAADTATVTPAGIEVAFAASGKKEVYPASKGWTLGQRGSVKRVERKERVVLSPQAKVEEVAEMQARVGGPFSHETESGYRVTGGGAADGDYPSGEGYHWNLVTGDDGLRALERDPHVNKFFNADNLIIVATSASFYGIMAVGLTAIIVLGGIDLSVGAIYALASVIGASLLHRMQAGAADGSIGVGTALLVGVGACCAVGALCGLVNGAASVGLSVHPFIITLGGMGVYRGTAFVITKGLSIGDLPPAYGSFVRTKVGGIEPVPLLVMILTGLIGVLVFTKTVFGRRIFAIGGNEVAARYAGVPVRATKVWVFVLAGLLAGLSAAIAIGKYGSASSADGSGYELDVIAAAVVGGASLTGGRGTALGAVLGAIVIQLINNGFEVLAIDANYKQIVIGLAIVLAVVIDQLKTRLTASGGRR